MRLQTESHVSFGRGMNDTAAASEYRRDELAYLLNGRVSFDGNAVERRDGSQRSHSAALNSGAQGYGGTEFVTAGGTQQLVVFVGDKMYSSINDGVDWTERATGLPTGRWSLVTMRVGSDNYLICANGGTNSYYWDGTTWAALSNIPDNVKYVAVFNDRLWYAGHSGHTVGASKVGDPQVHATPDGLSIQAATHDGDTEITGLFTLGNALLIFKRGSFGYLEGFGHRSLMVEVGARGLSRSVGCVAHGTIAPVGDQGVMWLSERGFEFYRLGGEPELVSRPVQNFVDGFSWSNIVASGDISDAL
jgi:hypothetical protein